MITPQIDLMRSSESVANAVQKATGTDMVPLTSGSSPSTAARNPIAANHGTVGELRREAASTSVKGSMKKAASLTTRLAKKTGRKRR